MNCPPSTFYSNFSLAELVKRISSHLSLEHLGGIGGGGGGGGTRFNRVGGQPQREARYHKTEASAIYLGAGGLAKTNEETLLSSLKADVQDQIVKSNACISDAGDLKIPGCYVDYSEEGIHGRIEVTGKLAQGNYYRFIATLTEISTSERSIGIEGIIRGRQPSGTHYVVPVLPDDPRATKDLLDLGKKLIQQSVENIRQKLLADYSRKDSLLQSVEYAQVYVWTRIPPEIKERLKRMMGEEFENPAEYDQFQQVYFLNEVAFRMYREAGADFAVLKTVSAEELPKIPGPSLSGPYLPENS
jgi:hypothetical protein